MGPKLILIACVAVVGIVYYAYSEKQKSIAERAQLNRDKAVSVLPPGTEEAWIAYVDGRIAASIQSRAGAISVLDTSNETTFVSRNTPYKVSCSPITGGSVVFGYGDDSITVRIYDLFYPVSQSPHLGVIASSIAAANLSKTLCERISESTSKIMLP